ncbi:MAG: hypothetical protein IPL35_08360 [Sphingobacteriales bacterium]|nr:hypothetical protein [Sphingobacteriales bacterium]
MKQKDGIYQVKDEVSWEEEKTGDLKEIFRDGKLLVDWSLDEVRKRIRV